MLHGKGAGNYSKTSQSWMNKTYEKKRRKGMEDRTRLSAAERLKHEISGSQGGGMTDDDTYEIKQFPFPVDQSIRRKQTIDVRKVLHSIGDPED